MSYRNLIEILVLSTPKNQQLKKSHTKNGNQKRPFLYAKLPLLPLVYLKIPPIFCTFVLRITKSLVHEKSQSTICFAGNYTLFRSQRDRTYRPAAAPGNPGTRQGDPHFYAAIRSSKRKEKSITRSDPPVRNESHH